MNRENVRYRQLLDRKADELRRARRGRGRIAMECPPQKIRPRWF